MIDYIRKFSLKGITILIALSLVLATTIWGIRWADERMNTRPLTLKDAYDRFGPIITPIPDEKATGQLLKTIGYVTVLPSVTEQPPGGVISKDDTRYYDWWVDEVGDSLIDITDVVKGEWNVDKRPHLRACIGFLNTPRIEQSLNSLAMILEKHPRLFLYSRSLPVESGVSLNTDEAGDSDDFIPMDEDIELLANTLAARARYRHTELADIHGAWKDLKTCLWLANIADYEYSETLHISMKIEITVDREIIHMAREQKLPAELVMEISRVLAERPDFLSRWKSAIKGDEILARVHLGTRYADTPDENGWLVLSAVDSYELAPWQLAIACYERNHFWDLASVFHRRFKAVDAKVKLLFDTLQNASAMEYKEGVKYLENNHRTFLFDDRDGPAWSAVSSQYPLVSDYSAVYLAMTRRNATQVALALCYYYSNNGEYPKTLPHELAGWPSEIPVDPRTGKPFMYSSEDGQDYRLWSTQEDWEEADCDYDVYGTTVFFKDRCEAL